MLLPILIFICRKSPLITKEGYKIVRSAAPSSLVSISASLLASLVVTEKPVPRHYRICRTYDRNYTANLYDLCNSNKHKIKFHIKEKDQFTRFARRTKKKERLLVVYCCCCFQKKNKKRQDKTIIYDHEFQLHSRNSDL